VATLVQKYGGTSVGSVERIENVARKVIEWKNKGDGNDIVVVVSAMSGETNRLIGLAESIIENPERKSSREYDVLVSTGEQVTVALLCMALQKLGQEAISYTGWQVPLRTDGSNSKARIESIDPENLSRELKAGKVVVVAGFQGVDDDNNITTLGRGGSDTTGVALAAAIGADECQIFTDVDGVYTTDPRVVKKARRLNTITFEEMLEMASLGSKVLQIRSVEFAGKYNVPLRVLSSFDEGTDNHGTLITYEDDEMEKPKVTGIAFTRDEAEVKVSNVKDTPGVAATILGAIADANIDVDMIVQNIGTDDRTDFTFTVKRNDYDEAVTVLNKLRETIGDDISISGDSSIAKLSIVGVGMKSHVGVASAMFSTLAKEGINIRMISTSEIKVSVVIDEKYLELGTRALHDVFELETPREMRA
jgi:aspartate kinase